MNFVDKDGTTKVYIPVHPCISMSTNCINFKVTVKIGPASCGDLVSTCPYECKDSFTPKLENL